LIKRFIKVEKIYKNLKKLGYWAWVLSLDPRPKNFLGLKYLRKINLKKIFLRNFKIF